MNKVEQQGRGRDAIRERVLALRTPLSESPEKVADKIVKRLLDKVSKDTAQPTEEHSK